MNKEEAIEVVKKNWPDSRYTLLREALETLIPELRESKDERIRKEMLDYLKRKSQNTLIPFSLTDAQQWIAWLEKQKEQKPQLYWHKIKAYEKLPCRAYIYKFAYEQENNFHGKATINGYLIPNEPVTIGCDTWYLPVEDIKNLPKEDELDTMSPTKTVEQKPADDKAFEEWIDDWWKHNKVNNPDSYDKGDEIQFDERGFKNFCRGIRNMYAEQKSAEWNPTNEDVILFNKAITTNTALTPDERAKLDIIRMKFKHRPAIKQEEQKPADEQFPPLEGLDAIKAKYYDDGFKNGFDEGVASVKPAEWSEEDEKIIWGLTAYIPEEELKRLGITRLDILKKLKSLRPQSKIHYWTEEEIEPIISDYLTGREHYGGMIARLRCLKPKSSWKPSEEELVALKRVGSILRDYGYGELAKTVFMIEGKLANLDVLNKPMWKPNEEQMKALNALNLYGNLSYVGQQNQLISLYQDLKKLM